MLENAGSLEQTFHLPLPKLIFGIIHTPVSILRIYCCDGEPQWLVSIDAAGCCHAQLPPKAIPSPGPNPISALHILTQ